MPQAPVSTNTSEANAVPFKERATIVCYREEQVLLVARVSSRWALPGGTIKRSETPLEAAHRELLEETGIVGQNLVYSMQFTGLAKVHHVFFAEVGAEQTPRRATRSKGASGFGSTTSMRCGRASRRSASSNSSIGTKSSSR